MAKYKFTIKIGTGTEQVFTTDSYNVTIKGERKIELGLFFMRYSINELSFLGDAYKLLLATFLNTSCEDCEIKVYQTCETAETEISVSYTHLRAHETVLDLVCRLLLEKKKK